MNKENFFSKQKWVAYAQLMRLDKPIGILLLLHPTLWALFVAANGMPPISILIIFTLGVVIMRSAGCVINDYADREIDGHIKRTSLRPLATGRVSTTEAKVIFIILLVLAFLLDLRLNQYTFRLSFVAVFLAIIYPFMKRFTHLPQVVLGMAFGWSIPMAFGAVNETLPFECWLLFLANLAWTIAYDTQYAMVDRDDDLIIGVKSTAILFAQHDNKIIALLQFITFIFLVLLGVVQHYHIGYFIVLVVSTTLFIYQYWMTKTRDRSKCFKAFLNNHYFGLCVFVAILVGIYF